MALALLIGSVVAYLTMWALGIGPVGSLLAQGVISEGDELLLVEFENRTDAAGLGRAVTAAFRADLSESRLFTLVGEERVAEGLARSSPGSDASLTPVLARELAAAERIRVLVEGEVRREGGGYRLSARIILPPTVSPVSQFHERALDDADLVPAIDLLAERIRLRLGESLRAIREAGPLTERWGAELEPSMP
jgi:TolB-like protein